MQNVVIRAIERLDFRTKEAYKTLRTNLSFAGKNVKVISLTSCTPNEGKTSVSFQLCLSLAESGKQTILVDADLRKSVLRGVIKQTVKNTDCPIISADRWNWMMHAAEPTSTISILFLQDLYRPTPVSFWEAMPFEICWRCCA